MHCAMLLDIQIYTGPYHRSTVLSVMDISQLTRGNLVAVNCDNCDKEPLITRVVEIYDAEVEIVWLEGEYSKSWKTAKHRDPNDRRRMVEWKDKIPKSSTMLFDFKLTNSNHLRRATIEHLKRAYADIRN